MRDLALIFTVLLCVVFSLPVVLEAGRKLAATAKQVWRGQRESIFKKPDGQG